MVRRTKQEALETRSRILDTAERVFHEKGVSRTSLADIASAAGVTRGAIYWHFENKADLFAAMMDRVMLPMEAMAKHAVADDSDDPLGSVRACALEVLQRTATDPRSQRVFDIVSHKCEYVDDMAQLRARHLQARGQCLARIEKGLRNAVRKKQLPRGTDARAAAVGLHALIDGLIKNWVLDPAQFALGREAGPMIDCYIAGLGAGLSVPAGSAARPSPAATKGGEAPRARARR
jgi:TetR/AcrR family acrAB operon transcriptional repressor